MPNLAKRRKKTGCLVSSTPPTFGSAEEAALKRAITRAFPEAHLFLARGISGKIYQPHWQTRLNYHPSNANILYMIFLDRMVMLVNAKDPVHFQDHLQFWCETVLNVQEAKLVEHIHY